MDLFVKLIILKIIQHINSVFTSNTWVILFDKTAYLIDCGDVEDVLDKLPHGIDIKAVFLTHTHFDHIYGIERLLEIYPEALIYTSEFGVEGLASSKKNFSRYHIEGPLIEFSSSNIRILHEGDIITLSDKMMMEIIETPGHDKSCLTYKLRDSLFTGDSYIPGVKIMTNFPNSNKEDANKSKERILKLAERCNLYPGHGEIVKSNNQ